MREGFLVRKRNFNIDFIQIFDNIGDGEFFEGFHHSLFDLGKVALAQITFPYLFWFVFPTLQQFTKIFTKRVPPHCFYRPVRLIGLVIFTPAGSLAQVSPITRPIAGAQESLGINKGLQKINRMIVNPLPIFGKKLGHTA